MTITIAIRTTIITIDMITIKRIHKYNMTMGPLMTYMHIMNIK